MKLTIKSDKLQEMVSKAMKGSSQNKMIPLTQMIAIELKENVLTLITTDATNYLYIQEDKVAGDDFYCVVQTDTFSKLIARMTCPEIILELKENALEVKGNGKYTIELPLDENGEMVKYPNPMNNINLSIMKPEKVHLSTVKAILNTVKPALATTVEVPCYTGYYAGENIVATDTYKICSLGIKLADEKKLISADMMDLLDVMTSEEIEMYMFNDDVIVFKTPDCVVYGTAMEGIEDYQIDAISGLLEQDFESMCKLPKNHLLQLLDRLALFVGTYDKNGIYLTFTKDGMQVNSKASSGTEIIQYQDSKNFTDFTCCIDIEMFRTQVKALAGDIVELYYGQETSIKIVEGNVTQIIALLEDDRIAE